MKKLMCTVIILLILAACTDKKKPKVLYDDNGEKVATSKDSAKILMADLPIYIDSTEFLVHPIGELRLYEKDKLYSGRSSWSSNSFYISDYNNYTFTGALHNLQFEKLGSNKLVALTQENIRIESAQFLHELYKTTGKQLFIYKIIDADTNADGILDYTDIKSLYVSRIDGSGFKKLNTNGHELIDFKIMNNIHRLYFRTISDKNKDGVFDEKDSLQYHYLNLIDDDLKVTTYFPV
ncbi:MAG: hypothetical protein NWQ38_04840 [Cellulophaga sp.]|nr:hypothetical protein [Cellulophaga sp.]